MGIIIPTIVVTISSVCSRAKQAQPGNRVEGGKHFRRDDGPDQIRGVGIRFSVLHTCNVEAAIGLNSRWLHLRFADCRGARSWLLEVRHQVKITY